MGLLFSNPINHLVFKADKADINEEKKYISKIIGPKGLKVPIYEKKGNIKKCLIISHGNASKLSKEVPLANLIYKNLNITVICYEYPGYGYTQKWNYRASEQGCYDSLKHVVNYAKNLGFKDSEIVLYGNSLGTGVTIGYASKGFNGKIILISPYKSITQVAYDTSLLYPIDMFRSIDKIQTIKNPILFIHGEDDDLIHYSHTIELHRKHSLVLSMYSKNAIKPIIVRRAGHNDIIQTLKYKNFFLIISKYINNEIFSKKI